MSLSAAIKAAALKRLGEQWVCLVFEHDGQMVVKKALALKEDKYWMFVRSDPGDLLVHAVMKSCCYPIESFDALYRKWHKRPVRRVYGMAKPHDSKMRIIWVRAASELQAQQVCARSKRFTDYLVSIGEMPPKRFPLNCRVHLSA